MTIEIPPGEIPVRKPRPLKRSERKRLREAAGGPADESQLASLAQSFEKSRRKKNDPDDDEKPSNNGWQ